MSLTIYLIRQAYWKLGKYSNAYDHYWSAFEISRQRYGEIHKKTAQFILMAAHSNAYSGKYIYILYIYIRCMEAIKRYEYAGYIYGRVFGTQNMKYIQIFMQLISLYLKANNIKQSIEYINYLKSIIIQVYIQCSTYEYSSKGE